MNEEPPPHSDQQSDAPLSVAVIIPHLNRLDDTATCCRSLAAQTHPPARIIIIDNGSTEHDGNALATACPNALVIRLETNQGFAAAVNTGIRKALNDDNITHMWLLNNDTICPPYTLAKLLEVIESAANTGLAGCCMIEGKGTTEERAVAAGKNLLSPFMIPVSGTPGHRPDYLSGACMLIKRAVIEQIGLFDEDFFFFFEDTDFCRRAMLRGWDLDQVKSTLIEHQGSSTVRHMNHFMAYHYRRSHVLYLRKYTRHPSMLAIPSFMARLIIDTLTFNVEAVYGNWLGFRSRRQQRPG